MTNFELVQKLEEIREIAAPYFSGAGCIIYDRKNQNEIASFELWLYKQLDYDFICSLKTMLNAKRVFNTERMKDRYSYRFEF